MANPVNRKEAILAGENVAPVTREEYFVKEAVSSGGGGGNPGYHTEIENLGTLIPQQTVTTEDQDGFFAGAITITPPEGMTEPPETLQVVFNGTSYNCPKIENLMPTYGAPWDDSLNDGEGGMDWSEYPFSISLSPNDAGEIVAESEGTYTVSADMVGTQLVIDPEFEEAVNSIANEIVVCYVETDPQDNNFRHIYKNGQALKYSEAKYLYDRGKLVVSGYFVSHFIKLGGNSCKAYLYTFATTANVTSVHEIVFSSTSEDGILSFDNGGGK